MDTGVGCGVGNWTNGADAMFTPFASVGTGGGSEALRLGPEALRLEVEESSPRSWLAFDRDLRKRFVRLLSDMDGGRRWPAFFMYVLQVRRLAHE